MSLDPQLLHGQPHSFASHWSTIPHMTRLYFFTSILTLFNQALASTLLYSITPLRLLSSKGPRTSACPTQAAISVFISLNLLAILTRSWFLVFSCVTDFFYFCWLLCLQCSSNCWNAMGLPVDTSCQEGPLQYHSFKPNLNADDIQLGPNLYV